MMLIAAFCHYMLFHAEYHLKRVELDYIMFSFQMNHFQWQLPIHLILFFVMEY